MTDTKQNDDSAASGKSRKKNTTKDVYKNYPALPTEPFSISLPFTTKKVVCSFEMRDGVEPSEEKLSDLVNIKGKMKYFLQANSVLIDKLKKMAVGDVKNVKFHKEFVTISLRGDTNETVIHPKSVNILSCNIPERYKILTKYNQHNWIVPKCKF